MKCYDCGGEFIEKFGTISLHDNIIGNYTVENIPYSKCSKCGEMLFSEVALKAIDTKEHENRERLIRKQSLEQFISAAEAAHILEISRQALHKNQRINRGLIYFAEFEGRKLYNKRSVILFKKSGDGRFPLTRILQPHKEKYIFISPLSKPASKARIFGNIKDTHNWSQTKLTGYASNA